MRLRRTLTSLGMSGAAVLAVLAVAVPAQASFGPIWTRNGDGGSMTFTSNGDVLTVCDEEADGRYADLRVYTASTLIHRYTIQAKSNGSCVTRSAANGGVYDLVEGVTYKFEICLDWAGGDRYNCDTEYDQA
ncbi:hypothetical protein V6V47_00945 [Micromonospora sp. CPCC 205539]|uniref:hypothetical protein n=1 Tax=Micromonospora sp. CPCC 205539 TaxID=3122408 RepID=UPI002FEF3221